MPARLVISVKWRSGALTVSRTRAGPTGGITTTASFFEPQPHSSTPDVTRATIPASSKGRRNGWGSLGLIKTQSFLSRRRGRGCSRTVERIDDNRLRGRRSGGMLFAVQADCQILGVIVWPQDGVHLAMHVAQD